MHVVQQVQVVAELLAQALEQRRREVQVLLGAPQALARQPLFGGLVVQVALADAVRAGQARDAALRADGLVAHLLVLRDGRDGVFEVAPVGVAVHQHAVARSAADQVVDGRVERLALDVPQRRVDGGNRRHRHRAAPPVRALVEVLPDVFDPPGVAADEARNHVIGQVAGHGQLAAVERRVAEPVHAFFGHDLQRDEVAARTRDDDLRVDDFHAIYQAELKFGPTY